MAWEAFMALSLGLCRSYDLAAPVSKFRGSNASQSALLMMNTAASSAVPVREPPAQTSTLPRIRAIAATS